MEGNGTFIPQAFTDLLLFHMNISCAFVSIILISFSLQSRAETENSKGCGMRGPRREKRSGRETEETVGGGRKRNEKEGNMVEGQSWGLE